MMLAEMDSIGQKHEINYTDIMWRFSKWFSDSMYTGTGEVFDIGISTNRAISNYLTGTPALECGGQLVSENGNGSLMRILPFVMYSYVNGLSEEDEVELLNNASSLTHAHEISKLGCKIYSDYIKAIFDNKTKEEALEHVSNIDYSKYYSLDSIEEYERILDGSIVNLDEDEIKSSGYVVSSLEASIWSFHNSSSYEEAVLKAINLGDDTDTVGAITGSLAGAFYGNVPDKWLSRIKNKELADEIYESFQEALKKKNRVEEESFAKR